MATTAVCSVTIPSGGTPSTWADFIIGEWIPRSLHIADSLRTQALLAMAPATANAGNGQAVCVINTTGHPRREWLTVGLPEGGTVILTDQAETIFTPSATGNCRYQLHGSEAWAAQMLEKIRDVNKQR